MAARAAEPIVEIEVAECGVEVVAPHQAHDASAEPDAFRVSARAVDGLGRLDEFVGFPLIILGGVGCIGGRRLAADPAGRGCRSGQTRQPIRSEGPGRQRRGAAKPQLLDQAPVDAYIPRLVSGRAQGRCDGLACCRPNWSPMRRTRSTIQMTGISDFVQQSHNFIMVVVKLPQADAAAIGLSVHLGRTPMNG